MFDFEKFKKLCNTSRGLLDIRRESDREYFISYLKDNGIPSTPYIEANAPYVYWEREYMRCFGFGTSIRNRNYTIYNISDFETVTLKADNTDILNFLGV